MHFALHFLSNSQHPCLDAIYLNVPEPLEARDPIAKQLYPWRTFLNRYHFSNKQCGGVITWSVSPKSSQKTPHSSPVRARCGVYFVSLMFDLRSAIAIAVLNVILLQMWPCYNGTRLYLWCISTFLVLIRIHLNATDYFLCKKIYYWIYLAYWGLVMPYGKNCW